MTLATVSCICCDAENPRANRFCGACGASFGTDIDAVRDYMGRRLPQEIDAILARRLKDQKAVEIETTELIAERLLKWAKIAGLVFGVPVAALAGLVSFVGLKSYGDLSAVLAKVGQLDAQVESAGRVSRRRTIPSRRYRDKSRTPSLHYGACLSCSRSSRS